MFGLFNIVSKYLSGGSVSVDGGREGDWLEDKFAKGGRITDAEINVGNRFGLPNGEVVEIKKRYIEDKYKGDDRIVVYTRSSDNREHESTLNGLKSFLNNWKAQLISKHNEQVLGEKYWTKYKNGGSLSEDMQMAKSDVMKLDEYAKKISDSVMSNQDVEAWVISKIAKVEQTTANVKHTLEAEYPEMFSDGGEIEHTDGNTVRMMCLHIGKYAKSMLNAIDNGVVFESWMKHELSIAGSMIDSVFHYLDYFNSGNHLANGGGIDVKRKMFLHDAVLYKGDLLYISLKDGVLGLANLKGGAWGSDYPFIPISKVNIDDVTDMVGRKVSIDGYAKGGGLYMNAEEYRDKLEAMTAEQLAVEYDEQIGVDVSPAEAEDEREEITDRLVEQYIRVMRSRGERGFENGGEVVKHLDIPNTMLDFTLKAKMDKGGKVVKYKLGNKWSDDFDYEGMLRMALTVNENWSVENLNKLYNSFEDVNYHNVNATLWKIIGYLKEGKASLAKAYIIIYKKKIAELLAEEVSEAEAQADKMVRGGTLAQRRKVGKVMHEFKVGKLKTHGRVVTDRNQAIAIALSEAGLSKKEEGGIIESFHLPATDFVPITNGGIPSYNTPLDHWALYYEKGGKIKSKN